ncbi:MAG: type II secretion system protein M [Oceanospirillaceae bacterium]|nr:type II secretion system protein M [Oceanospirillaceae bacterium]
MDISKISTSYELLSQREKVLVLLSSVAVIVGLLFILLLEPQYLSMQAVAAKYQSNQQALQLNQQQIEKSQQLLSTEPEQVMRDKLLVLQAEKKDLAQSLAQSNLSVLSTVEFTNLLADILEQDEGLRVADFTLKAEPFRGEEDYVDEPALVLQQQLKLRLQGSDIALKNYLKRLEAMPVAISWDSIEYQYGTDQQRNISIALSIFTAID